jgi:acyl carrier protein
METLTELVATVLDLPAGDVNDDLGPATHADWTSVKHLQLIVAMEDRYGLSFTRDEIRAIRSVRDAREGLLARGVEP